jgi:hypothetical protein
MRKTAKIDYTKLLGFDTVGDQISKLDFCADALSARLGAKVGVKDLAILDLPAQASRTRQ